MGNDGRWDLDAVDEEDSHDLPKEMLQTIVARIRTEQHRRWVAAQQRVQQAPPEVDFDPDGSLDGSPPYALQRQFLSPGPFFAWLAMVGAIPMAIIYWIVAR